MTEISSTRSAEGGTRAVDSLHAVASIAPGQLEPGDGTVSEHELRQALSAFGLTEGVKVRPLRRGDPGSPKFEVSWSNRRFLLKRRSRAQSEPARVALCHEVLIEAKRLGAPVPRLFGTNPGDNSMLQLGGHVYELMEFVEGSGFDRSEAQSRAAGRALAAMHAVLARCRPTFEAPRGSYHASAEVRRQFDRAMVRLGGDDGARSGLRACKEHYESAAERSQRALAQGAPEDGAGRRASLEQLVHGDWHPGNLLYAGESVAWVLDLDGAAIAPPATDVAMGALQFSLDVHRSPAWSLSLNTERLDAFLDGYRGSADTAPDPAVSAVRAAALSGLMIESLIAEVIPPIAETGSFGDRSAAEAVREVAGIVQRLDEWAENQA